MCLKHWKNQCISLSSRAWLKFSRDKREETLAGWSKVSSQGWSLSPGSSLHKTSFFTSASPLAGLLQQYRQDLCFEVGKALLCHGLSHTCWVCTISRALGSGAISWSWWPAGLLVTARLLHPGVSSWWGKSCTMIALCCLLSRHGR